LTEATSNEAGATGGCACAGRALTIAAATQPIAVNNTHRNNLNLDWRNILSLFCEELAAWGILRENNERKANSLQVYSVYQLTRKV
jgi:hypothetical protein